MILQEDIAKELRSYAWFSAFSDELIHRFSTDARTMTFPSGHILLNQGGVAENFYVLRSGTVEVLVDNELVAVLNKPGEMLGEMGVITGEDSSATVRAGTEVDCFVFDSDSIKQLQNDERYHLLYKTFAHILAARVKRTNDKAKRFEEANRELMLAKKELEVINKSLEKAGSQKADDLSHTLFRTLERVVGSAGELASIPGLLESLSKSAPSGMQEKTLQARRVIESLTDRLKPLDSLYDSEIAVQSRKVLFVDSNKKQQVVARMALGGTGVDLEIHSSTEELESPKYDLLFCEVNQIKEIERLYNQHPEGKIVVMVSGEISDKIRMIQDLGYIDHLVSVDPGDKTFTVRNIVSTVTKVLTGNLFGLDKYLSFGADIQKRTVKSSAEREILIEEMNEYFRGLGVRRSILGNVCMVVEELLMNAIYDAPVDDKGNSLYNHLPRTTPVNLQKHEEATLCYATDGIYIGVAVIDPFGALKPETLLVYLDSCYSGVPGSMNQNKGGAGRGLHQIIEGANLTIFNVRRRKRTEAISLFLMDPSEIKQSDSTLHYFFDGPRQNRETNPQALKQG